MFNKFVLFTFSFRSPQTRTCIFFYAYVSDTIIHMTNVTLYLNEVLKGKLKYMVTIYILFL